MLTKMEAIHPRFPTVPFVFDMATIRTDPFQIRNIDGLGPVAATVASDPYSGFDGEQVTGLSVGKRNIVFTLGFNPNYSDLDLDTPAKLRQEAYKYFMPKQKLTFRLTFSHISNPCLIEGIVETVEPNIFSQDPEMTVSVLCHMPYFVEDDLITITANALTPITAQSPMTLITYEGTIPTGFEIVLDVTSGSGGTNDVDFEVISRSFDPDYIYELFRADNVTLTSSVNPKLITKDGEKNLLSGSSTNLKAMADSAVWPKLYPGDNYVFCRTSLASPTVVGWTLTYKNMYGGF